MTKQRAIEMIDEYLLEPHSINYEWADVLKMCRDALLNNGKKYSKWEISFDGYYPYCLECGYAPDGGKMTDFCPKCGSRMDGKKV